MRRRWKFGCCGAGASRMRTRRTFRGSLAAHHAHPARAVQRAGARPGRDRNLRRDFLLGSAAIARDRHPDGAGRAARRCDAAGAGAARGGKIAAAGIVIGSAASLGLTRLMAKVLYSVSVVDPATLAVVAFVLALIATVASYIPARRALLVDPLVALRNE